MNEDTQDVLEVVAADNVWSHILAKAQAPNDETREQRQREIRELVKGRPVSTIKRVFVFRFLTSDYFTDELVLVLYSNAVAALSWDKGPIDHNTNDHRVGLYSEIADNVVVECISLWRENDKLSQFVFRKMPDGNLSYSDPEPEVIGFRRHCLVKEKVLKLVE